MNRPEYQEKLSTAGVERIRKNLLRCQQLMAQAQARSPLSASTVELVAVTKYVGPDHVRALHDLGIRDFGESTVLGCERKREALGRLVGCRWHLIGHLQRNKVARALSVCDTIHSLDSKRLAREISAQATRRARSVPELYIELQLTGETGKTGLEEDALRPLLVYIGTDPALAARLRGLMAMAPHAPDARTARPYFRRLRELRNELARAGHHGVSGLSMGMSNDFEVAIEEGATVVRVGSLLFEDAS